MSYSKLTYSEIDINAAAMSELGSIGVDLSASIRRPSFRRPRVTSPLPDVKPHDGVMRSSINIVQRTFANRPEELLKVLQGEVLGTDPFIKMFMHSLPRVVPMVPDMTFRNAIYACTKFSAIQRIFVFPETHMTEAQLFKPYTWNPEANNFIFFMLHDPRLDEKFEAQSLFSVDLVHTISTDAIDSLKTASDGFINKSGMLQTCIGTLVKLNTMWRHKTDLLTLTTTFVDLLLSWGVGYEMANKAWEMLSGHFQTIMSYLFDFKAQAGSDCSMVFLRALCAIIASILAIFGTMALPSQKLLDMILKRTSDMGRAFSGFTQILDMMKSLFDKVFGWVYEFIFGVPLPNSDLDELLEGVSKWYDEVSSISDLDSNDNISTDFRLCRKIEKLYKEGQDYVRRIEQFKLTQSQKQPFLAYWRIVVKLYDRAIGQGARSHAPRTEPLIIQLFGASSVGKSGLTYLLAQDLLAMENLQEHVMDEVYFRNVEQEFWDGYHGQAICVYDDFGQVRDSAANPNKEFMEIIRTGNIAPWPLHMAQIEEKARTRFTSRACILTSNQKKFDMASLTHGTAFMRRLDIYAEVSVKPEFATRAGRIDHTKVEGPLDHRVYQFRLFGEDAKPLTHIVERGGCTQHEDLILDYNMFKLLAQSIYSEKFNKSASKIECILQRGRTMRHVTEPIDTTIMESLTRRCQPESFRAQICTGECVIRKWQAYVIMAWYAHVIKQDLGMRMKIPDCISKLVVRARDYSTFLRDSFNLLGVEEPASLVETTEEGDEFWDAKESFIYENFPERTGLFSTAKQYATACKNRLLSALKGLVDKVPDETQAKAMKLMKAFGCCIGVVFALYGASKIFGTKEVEFKAETVDEDRKPKRTLKEFVAETVDEDRIPKARNKTFVAETVDEDRIPKSKAKNFKAENQSDTDHKLSRRERKQLRAEAAIDNNAAELVSTTIRANTYMLYVSENDMWKPRVNMVFVQGRIAVMVAHAVPYLRENMKIANSNNKVGIFFNKDEIKITPFTTSKGDSLDLVSIVFPRQVPAHATLSKQFVKMADLPSFKNVRGNLFSVFSHTHRGVEQPSDKIHTVVNVNACDSQIYTADASGKETEYTLRKGYIYEAETRAGDCTSPLVVSNPQIPRKIVGLHVAGANTGRALALSVTQDMLKEHIDKLGDFEAQVYYDMDELPVQEFTEPELPEGGFLPIGKATVRVGSSSITQLRESKIHGVVTQPITKPATLGKVRVNGQVVDPMYLGLKKCGGSSPILDTDLLERCKKHIIAKLKKFTYNDKKVLTHEEAITGIAGDPWLTPMNRRSSPGFPWSFKREGTIGKTKWLGSGEEYILDDPDLLQVCQQRIEAAKEGKRIPPVWTDTLKDERRPIEKVNAGKTRVFSAGSMDYILNVRQYFLSFNAAMMENRIKNEIALGVNPFGLDWHQLAMHITSKGDNVCAGDFSNFDGSLPSVMLWAICDIINAWYNDSEENQKIRTVLFADIVNGIHINGDNLYQWTHSQPSGNPLTTIINCLINSLIFRYVFVKCTNLTLADWDKKISFISYGDDNVIGIHGSILKQFNQIRISEECAKMGFTYTDEAKTGELVTSKRLSEIGFLKRAFRKSDLTGLYEAPLELSTVLELINWVRSDLDPDTRCADNVEICYKELSLHGESVFNEWTPIIEDACYEHLSNPPTLYSFEEYSKMVLEYY